MHQHGACRHGQPDYRSCDSAFTRQQSRRANHGHESKWKHPSEIVPAPLDAKDLEGQATSRTRRISKGQATGRTRRISKGQATGRGGGHDGDKHAGGCLPQLARRRPGLGSGHVTPRGQGWRGEPTHGRAHGNLMPRPRQRRALLAIPKLGGPHQPRQPGLRLASRGSGHRSRTRRISKGQGTGRGGKRRGQSCGGLSAPARKTEARPRQRAHHATSSGIARRANAWARARQFNATPTPA